MADEDFGDLRSALHARDTSALEALIPQMTPEAASYAYAHLERWEDGNLWSMDGVDEASPLAALPRDFEDDALQVARILRLTHPITGDAWYRRVMWEAGAAPGLHRFAWSVAQDILTRFNLADQAHLSRAMAYKRGWMEGRVTLERLEDAREASEDRSPRDPLGLHGLSFRRWVGATLVHAATAPRADEAVWGVVEAMELPRLRDALLEPVSRGIGSTLDALLSGSVTRLLQTAESSVQQVLAGLSVLSDPNISAREGLDAALHEQLLELGSA